MQWAPVIGIHAAKMKARAGDIDGAIEMSRALIDELFASGEMAWRGPATTTLVQLLLGHGGGKERHAAQAAIDRLASVPVDPGFVVYGLPLLRLRALLAQARGDDATYREHARCYRAMATSLGFQGHIALAEAMA